MADECVFENLIVLAHGSGRVLPFYMKIGKLHAELLTGRSHVRFACTASRTGPRLRHTTDVFRPVFEADEERASWGARWARMIVWCIW